ncbi:hypothetical protein [Mucilaginibacter aquaedulcis]|uniref:hypothetical protein n=1 Tax=Mucilaginibacter aquaedulcis TaxID=1187081 RepID=UPI0025B30784|nr:hypothetical protein [Mucilaginibacter aquaedulcis]MDN3550769.1 hypothetical protein [Mucilaginibacter aquaedulcis]
MISIRSKNVLLVAPDTFPVELLPESQLFRHISSIATIFPTIHELKPNLIILDHEYVIKDIERILRRISSNPSYNKIKVCCYKKTAHTKTDGLLKALGVDHIFYQEDFSKEAQSKNTSGVLSSILDTSIVHLLAKAVH